MFLDANVLLAAVLNPEGGSSRLWTVDGVALVTSEQALREAWINLGTERGRARWNAERTRARLTELMLSVEIVPASAIRPGAPSPSSTFRDSDDASILASAIASRCHFLLTNDSDCFGPYFGKRLEGVLVQRAGAFLRDFIEKRPM